MIRSAASVPIRSAMHFSRWTLDSAEVVYVLVILTGTQLILGQKLLSVILSPLTGQ